jgi:hypothetical protein
MPDFPLDYNTDDYSDTAYFSVLEQLLNRIRDEGQQYPVRTTQIVVAYLLMCCQRLDEERDGTVPEIMGEFN